MYNKWMTFQMLENILHIEYVQNCWISNTLWDEGQILKGLSKHEKNIISNVHRVPKCDITSIHHPGKLLKLFFVWNHHHAITKDCDIVTLVYIEYMEDLWGYDIIDMVICTHTVRFTSMFHEIHQNLIFSNFLTYYPILMKLSLFSMLDFTLSI